MLGITEVCSYIGCCVRVLCLGQVLEYLLGRCYHGSRCLSLFLGRYHGSRCINVFRQISWYFWADAILAGC